jgi:nickel/cobalt transporter (NicO) family protein
MSVIVPSLPAPVASTNRLGLRLALALVAVAVVAAATAVLAWLIHPSVPLTAPKHPFGVGVREAAPSAQGLGAWILAVQGGFYRSLQAAVLALKSDGGALWSLTGLGFAYGVFHAAGPGHGKAVIAAYLISSERALVKGFALSLAAALVQALVAVALVGSAAVLLQATAAAMSWVTHLVEITSFAAVAVLGCLLVWRKTIKVLRVAALARDPLGPAPAEACCDHAHLPSPEAIDGIRRWREAAGVVLAAGARPCAGAIIVLVFALAQGVFAAGVAAAFAMALGTALTTGAIAMLAVFAKALALRIAGGRGAAGALAVAGLELLAAAFVLVLGASLLLGLWTGPAAS